MTSDRPLSRGLALRGFSKPTCPSALSGGRGGGGAGFPGRRLSFCPSHTKSQVLLRLAFGTNHPEKRDTERNLTGFSFQVGIF